MYTVVEERMNGQKIVLGTRNTMNEARELQLSILTQAFELGSTVTIKKVS